MMERMDAVLTAKPRLTFALPLDLKRLCARAQHHLQSGLHRRPGGGLARNRTKRFFLDSPALTRAARMELGVELPTRQLTRSEIERTGARLKETAGATSHFLLQTYARDTGAVLTTLSVPLFVKGQRFGVVTLGWDPERLQD
jgi:methyl-accepting chemotaxis protein